MRTLIAHSTLAASLLLMGCSVADKAPPPNTPDGSGTPGAGQAFPAEGPEESAGFAAEAESAAPAEASDDFAPASPAPAAGAPSSAGERASAAPRSRAEAKRSARPLDVEPERPGLGTSWGETRNSHVTNAPFDRASSNPFSIAAIHYNDQSGVAAMLRGASFADFRGSATPVQNGMLTVRVTDGRGSTLPTFMGNGRTLVQGEIGQRYMIEITNQSSNRFEAVVTVDGLDVIDGRPGSFEKRGYLVHPFATVQIDGFRQNMDQVAAFRFGSVRGSYAAGKGSDRNVGVIGVAFFAERGARQPWTRPEIGRRESGDAFPGRFAAPPVVD
jgi:hypothetical protein